MYESEFDTVREAQEPHQVLSEEQWDKLREVIFCQRPLQPVDPGWCRFEDGEQRAAKALPAFQEFRMLQEVNNLRVLVGAEPERALDEHERERALRRLRSGKDIILSKGRDNTPAKPTGDLGLPSGAVFNLSSGGRKAVKGDETAVRLAKPDLFGEKWLGLSLDERNEIVRYLLKIEDPDVARDRVRDQWGLSDAQSDAVANVAFVSGYGNLSEKAIRNMLPHLKRGLVFSKAAQAAGYHHSDFRNGEAPDKLPYTGRTLSFGMVMSSQTEVDHILPFSRTLDNSMANMVVCVADANRAKGDQSPHEAFDHSPPGYSYDDILARAAELPSNKRWRFQDNAMERFEGERGFLDRQLNETRYLSRTARARTSRTCTPRNPRVVNECG